MKASDEGTTRHPCLVRKLVDGERLVQVVQGPPVHRRRSVIQVGGHRQVYELGLATRAVRRGDQQTCSLIRQSGAVIAADEVQAQVEDEDVRARFTEILAGQFEPQDMIDSLTRPPSRW
ncbi:hypothetical protein GCM10010219_14180 [Streptomyces netropsis]|nr:hypothetical protein GCM10010219_14180 [Streptomyces netropsis]